jgi:hypothetical protein
MARKYAPHTRLKVYTTVLFLGCLLLVAPPLFPQTQSSDLKSTSVPAPEPVRNTRVVQNLAKSRLRFEVNQGQSDQRVEFLSRGQGYTLFLTGEEAVLNLAAPREQKKPKSLNPKTASQNPPASTSTVVRMKLAGVRASKAVGIDPLPTKSNYLLGNNPAKWRRSARYPIGHRNGVPWWKTRSRRNASGFQWSFSTRPGRF